jgi:hypothetical protein
MRKKHKATAGKPIGKQYENRWTTIRKKQRQQ